MKLEKIKEYFRSANNDQLPSMKSKFPFENKMGDFYHITVNMGALGTGPRFVTCQFMFFIFINFGMNSTIMLREGHLYVFLIRCVLFR